MDSPVGGIDNPVLGDPRLGVIPAFDFLIANLSASIAIDFHHHAGSGLPGSVGEVEDIDFSIVRSPQDGVFRLRL